MERIKKNDTVLVVAGKDKGKTGSIIEILPVKGKVKVKGISIITKHAKAKKSGETSSIKKLEAFIDSSNVMPICSSCKKPARVGVKIEKNDKKIRMCKRCDATF